MKKICFLCLSAALLAACDLPSQKTSADLAIADTILTHGKIYTMNPRQPWAEAVAITNGNFSFVGSSDDVDQYQGERTRVIDLLGKMAMPGLNDLHVHPVYGFTVQLFECVFPPSAVPDDIAQSVSKCVEENPDAEWIVGGQWESGFFTKYDIASPREWLDRVSGDKAVILGDTSFHNRWVNSKALALAGLDKNSEEIPGGEIVRDAETGEPTGLLLESAAGPVLALVPDWTPKQYLQAAQEGIKTANRFGITGVKEAWATLQNLQAYKAIDDTGEVNVHLATSISIFPLLDDEMNVDTDILARMREQYRGQHVNTDFVKIFMDGVPSSRTAAMLADYLPMDEGAETHHGQQHYPDEILARLITQLDQLGMTVKSHTAGDRAVRVTLDAIEHARKVNGDSGLRHELAHAGYIDDADIPRFAELNAVAEVSPYIWFPSNGMESITSVLGERGRYYWPIKTLLESGAEVVAGSDWPAGGLASMNPWIGLESMISRRNPWGEFPGVLWEEQAITLEQTLRIYTQNGAKALKLETVTGSIETGKLADIIVLNQNLFDIPTEQISDTQVKMTLFEGKVVYEK